MPKYSTFSVTAQNQFSPEINLRSGGVLTLTGTWSATVTLQRKLPDESGWVDVTNNSGTATTFTTNGTFSISPSDSPSLWRWGVKTGNYTSGTVVGFIEGV